MRLSSLSTSYYFDCYCCLLLRYFASFSCLSCVRSMLLTFQADAHLNITVLNQAAAGNASYLFGGE